MELKLPSRIPSKHLMLFTRQLSAMLSAGLPLSKSLATLAIQTENKALREALKKVTDDVKSGKPFAEALQKDGRFPHLYCSMVGIGEKGASLDGILQKLAKYLEKQEKIKSKILSAMTYPAVVLLLAVCVVVALLTFVIPTFTKMFTDTGNELPAATQAVISLSDFIRSYFVLMILGGIALVLLCLQLIKRPDIRLSIDSALLKIPVLGSLLRKTAISRFSGTLGTLLQTGVPLVDAMKITATTAGNRVVEAAVLKSLSNITRGREIAKPLEETGIFPPMVIQMVAVGEETGKLSDMLLKVSEFYDAEVDAAVERLTSILEPVMILLLGLVVAGLLIAMYLPMFDMIGNVQ
ncbi:MAG: type II secretion system F family protein [Fibrobacterota bacterium]